MANSTADREIVVTRVIDAPQELVFAAFTEREHVEKWWGGGNTTTLEWDGQPGGHWLYSQPGPDGSEYKQKVKYIEIARPTRLVYEYGPDMENAPEPVRTSVTFEEQNGKTKVTLQLLFATAAALEEAAKYGAAKGAEMALETLADYVVNL